MKKVDVLEGNLYSSIIRYCIPLLIMGLVQKLFNAVDVMVLGVVADDVAVASVGATSNIVNLMLDTFLGLALGARIVLARLLGAKDEARAQATASTSLILSVVLGLLSALAGFLFAPYFLEWTNCPAECVEGALIYIRLYLAGASAVLLYNFASTIIQVSGDANRPMIYMMISGSVNVVLNFVLCMVLEQKVAAVAIATLVSQMLGAALALARLARERGALRIRLRTMRWSWESFGLILKNGIPSALTTAMYPIANLQIQTQVNSFGPAATTGISIANNFDGILYQIVVAPSLAVMPYVSQNLGARSLKRAKKSVLCGIGITVAFGATIGALSAIFSGQLSSIMSSDPVVIAYSRQKMMLISGTYFICGINEVMGASMRGLGRSVVPTVATLLFQCGIRFVWVYAVFPLYPHLTFLYLIWPIGWVLSIITVTSFYLPAVKRLGARLSTPGN